MSKVEKMVKKNYELSKKLTPENDAVYTDIVCYLRTSALDELETEEIIEDIIGMFLETQERGEKIEKVIGDDYQAFCDSIIEAAQPKKFTWRKMFSNLEIVVYVIAILWLIDLVFIYLPQTIKQGRLILDYQVNLGFLLNTAIILLAVFSILNYIGKTSFQDRKEKHQRKRRENLLWGCIFGGIIALLVFIPLKLGSFILFSMKIYYLAAVLAGLYLLLRVVKGKLPN